MRAQKVHYLAYRVAGNIAEMLILCGRDPVQHFTTNRDRVTCGICLSKLRMEDENAK